MSAWPTSPGGTRSARTVAVTAGHIGRFLDQLPAELPIGEANEVMAAVARHAYATSEMDPPAAFADVGRVDTAVVTSLLADLPDEACTPDALGVIWENLMSTGPRRTQGAHFTPRETAERVVQMAIDSRADVSPIDRVWDPAAGGGAFLLAAARQLEDRTGCSRAEIVERLYATDIDPVALRVCDAALSLWAGGTARPVTAVGDALVDLPSNWPTDFSVVIGNPPFLGQLTSDTARSSSMSERLRLEFGTLATGYVDQAALFVELGLRRLADDGALAMILPQSILGSRDAAAVRESAAERACLSRVWVDDEGIFDASVEVIAISMVRAPEGAHQEVTQVSVGDCSAIDVRTPEPHSWAPLLAAVQGVPQVSLPLSTASLGEIATATAGFRQHFYGIADAVREDETSATGTTACLMTSGAIDPLANLWGRRSVKFAGTKWNAPKLVLDAIPDPAVRSWFDGRLVPKVLLASQTPVLEAVVDPDGTLAPSVPVISIEPDDPEMVWHVAAVVTAPPICAFLLAEAAGTGLSSAAIRVRAQAVAALPLPSNSSAWDRGAEAGRRAHDCWLVEDEAGHEQALAEVAGAMVEAYAGDAELFDWWWSRLRKRR